MKIIGIGIKPTKIFDMCSYYSLKRVFLTDDPNNTHILNEAYSMTEDDRGFFFNEEYLKACAELSILTLPLRRSLILTDDTGDLPAGFRNDWVGDVTIFYYNVADRFGLDLYAPFMIDFLKMTVLKNWYELKNKFQEVELIEYKLVGIRKKIKNVVFEYSHDGESIVPYNNGFSNTYLPKKEPQQIPTPIDILNVGVFTVEYTEEYT